MELGALAKWQLLVTTTSAASEWHMTRKLQGSACLTSPTWQIWSRPTPWAMNRTKLTFTVRHGDRQVAWTFLLKCGTFIRFSFAFRRREDSRWTEKRHNAGDCARSERGSAWSRKHLCVGIRRWWVEIKMKFNLNRRHSNIKFPNRGRGGRL